MKRVMKKLNWKIAIAAIFWVLSINFAGSEGPLYINLLAAGVFFLSSSVIVGEASCQNSQQN